jgi:hypothetical protein
MSSLFITDWKREREFFPLSFAQNPISPSLFPVSNHHRAQPYNTIPLPSIHPTSSLVKPLCRINRQLRLPMVHSSATCWSTLICLSRRVGRLISVFTSSRKHGMLSLSIFLFWTAHSCAPSLVMGPVSCETNLSKLSQKFAQSLLQSCHYATNRKVARSRPDEVDFF